MITVTERMSVLQFKEAFQLLIEPLVCQPHCIEFWIENEGTPIERHVAGVRDVVEIRGASEEVDEIYNENVPLWIVTYRKMEYGLITKVEELYTKDTWRALRAAVSRYWQDYDELHDDQWQPDSI